MLSPATLSKHGAISTPRGELWLPLQLPMMVSSGIWMALGWPAIMETALVC